MQYIEKNKLATVFVAKTRDEAHLKMKLGECFEAPSQLSKFNKSMIEFWANKYNYIKEKSRHGYNIYKPAKMGDRIKMKFKDAPNGSRFNFIGDDTPNGVYVKINAYDNGLVVKWNGNIEGHQSYCCWLDEENGYDFDTLIELV